MAQIKRKQTKVDWGTFVARRRLNLQEWAKNNRIFSYADVVKWCEKQNIETPAENLFEFLLTEKKQLEEPKVLENSEPEKEDLEDSVLDLPEDLEDKILELEEEKDVTEFLEDVIRPKRRKRKSKNVDNVDD